MTQIKLIKADKNNESTQKVKNIKIVTLSEVEMCNNFEISFFDSPSAPPA